MSCIDQKVGAIGKDMDELKGDIKALNARPGKWWDKIASAAVATGLVAAVLALILKLAGISGERRIIMENILLIIMLAVTGGSTCGVRQINCKMVHVRRLENGDHTADCYCGVSHYMLLNGRGYVQRIGSSI